MSDDDPMKSLKELELSGYVKTLSLSEQTLNTAKLAATNIVEGLNTVIEMALVNMEQLYSSLPGEIKTKITESLSNIETKISTAKNNVFKEFETKYKTEIENAMTSLHSQKQTLIDSLKEDN
jgi:predicted sulfurtransferase